MTSDDDIKEALLQVKHELEALDKDPFHCAVCGADIGFSKEVWDKFWKDRET